MKIKTFICLMFFCTLGIFAQEDGNFLGTGPGNVTPSFISSSVSSRGFDLGEYRKVNNQIMRVTEDNGWRRFQYVQIVDVGNDGVTITVDEFEVSKYVFIKNPPETKLGYAEGQRLMCFAYECGTISTRLGTLELWDCGISCPAPPPSKEEIAAGLARMEAVKKAIAVRQLKAYLVQSNAVEWLKPQATNGDASAQCSLGLHYLNGIGCKKDSALALFWLRAASDNGDIEASNKLVSVASK